tara:strand:+ start:629 stop:1657 length:1029 start_codon:yes stop_codon:yes gene_type:complete
MIGYYIENNPQKASSRIRYLNIIKYLNNANIELYNNKNHSKYSTILFGKKFLDEDVKLAKTIKDEGKSLYFDICDNYFHNPNNLESYKKYTSNIKEMMNISDKVILSSNELKKHVIKELPQIKKKIIVIEDAHEEELIRNCNLIEKITSILSFIKFKFFFNKKDLNLVWFGNAKVKNAPAGMIDLINVKALIEKANKNHRINLTIISNNKDLYKKYIANWNIKTHYLEWDNNNFIDILKLQDAALIPIDINPFTQCKTNNRLVQSIMNNLDVIADEIPSYEEFYKYCFLNNWQKGLEEVINSKKNKEKKMIRINGARKIIKEKYLINTISLRWQNIFNIINQ